jgi:hypothetical protein
MTQPVHTLTWGGPPPPRRSPVLAILLTLIGAAALLAAVAAVVANQSTTASVSAAPTTTAPATSTTFDPLEEATTLRQVISDADRIGEDLGAIRDATYPDFDHFALDDACSDLERDVQTAQEVDLSTLKPEVAEPYSEALDHYGRAADFCLNSEGYDEVFGVLTEVGKGNDALQAATAGFDD